MKRFFTFALLSLAAGLVLAACTGQGNSMGASSLTMIILKDNWNKLNLGYKGDPAQAALQSADTGDPLFVLGIKQIETYDWDQQTLTLTADASADLGKALAGVRGAKPDEIAKLIALKESLGWGNAIERALYIHPFIVQVDRQFVYGGIFLDAPSQMAIDFPVARVMLSEGRVVFALLPTHVPFVMVDPVDGSGALRKPTIADEARDDVQQLDYFSEWSSNLATSDASTKYRSIIRDERIRLILEAAGK